MRVSYNRELITLNRDCRQLGVLGFPIPQKILKANELAKKFAGQAMQLQKIANFHNTIGDRMIISQRPMMLEAAVGLAQLVKEQTDMTWTDTDKIGNYIKKLREHTDKLARQNNMLASFHKQVRDKVLFLMNTDLLRQQNKWKDILKEIRLIMTQVEQNGFTNLKTWRAHWDRQLYKALEHQYQVGLEALNEHLPEIQVDLIYRQQQLQFRPPIEEIRMKYFTQLKRFLSIPNNFRGVGESTENLIFPLIIERNAHRFGHLFKKAEELFQRLEHVKMKFKDWVVLGSVNLEEMIEENCLTPEDWERNFRSSKAKGQEIGRINMANEKIDCIQVSVNPVRTEIEMLNRKLWDTLVNMLQRSILNDITDIEKFAVEAMDTLRKQPQSVDEIGEANKKHKEYEELSPTMMKKFENADQKNKILAAWSRESVDQVARVAGIWDNFTSLMGNFELVISKQVEAIQSNLMTQVGNVNGEIDKFKMRWDQLKPKEDSMDKNPDKIYEAIAFVKEKRLEWNELITNKDKLIGDCNHFGIEEPEFSHFEEINSDLLKYEVMWGMFEEFNSGMEEMTKEEWIVFRSKVFKFEDYLNSWKTKLNSQEKANTVTVKLLQEIEKTGQILPVLKYVRGDIFSDKHWTEMYGLLNMQPKKIDHLVFGDFLKVKDNLISREKELQELNNRAAGEVVIREALNELDVWEVEAKFSFIPHQSSMGDTIPLIKDWKDILNKVGDNQVLLQSIKGSPYFSTFGERAVSWERKLSDLDEVLHNLNTAQRKWVYLEPYQEQMKLKQNQSGGFNYREVFKRIDDDFRLIMGDAKKDNRVTSVIRIGSIKSMLTSMLEKLERCQKSLNDFLEEKRSSFPRFYFIGDDDLLQILGQATKPAVIQTHLKKLFAGIHNVNFDDEGKQIITMNSLQGEIVPLKNPVRISSEVERWMSQLSEEMKNTLKELLKECLQDSRKNDGSLDPLKYPSQILSLTEAIRFSEKCEESIKQGRLSKLHSELESQLDSYTSTDLDDDENSKVLQLKLKALILDVIHYIDIVKILDENRVKSVDHWLWQKQLRFYQLSDNNTKIRMVDAEFLYTFEYQGNAPKLVHTPLTDKCYLTLTQGMKMGLGGNPYGPAGTGKTESVKALGGLFGRQVLVFNCDEGIDIKSMGRIFIGLVKSGAWGCFDEFNRLEEMTLSAVSMQIQPIQTALKQHLSTVILLDKETPLDPNSGIFVTMNPAGKGYGGRQKLPDNLKQLFRPVVMSKPDNELIAEVSLFSEGFKDAHNIGKKLVGILNASKQLLTPQQHYDWGLRALMPLLRGCGAMLKIIRTNNTEMKIDNEKEAEIAVNALRLNTISKLTFIDNQKFEKLVKDFFPNVEFSNAGYEQLDEALRESCVELGLEVNEKQIRKAIELYEQLKQRMGVVIVGPSGSGKTTLTSILKLALDKLGLRVKQLTINPKAIGRTQLLGHIDLDTREWTNGILTIASLQAVDEPTEVTTWIVCDGDVDPEWVESLNSVLDENRLLTLPSGWRIQFGPNVNFIFETHDLTYASPATISRMAVIFLSDEDTNIPGVVNAWIKKQPDESQDLLQQLIDESFYKALDWCIRTNDFVIETSLVGTVMNGLSHITSEIKSKLEFCIEIIKGFGGNLGASARDSFAKEVLQWCGESPPSRNSFAIFYNKDRDRIENYSNESTNDFEVESVGSGELPLIFTANVQLMIDCITPWLTEEKQPFIIVGPEGSGKSKVLNYCFQKLRGTNVAVIHCSANITPFHVMEKLSQMCLTVSSSNGRVYTPKEAEKLILCFKDLNLSKPDKYGTSQLISFLQQIITYNGFFDKNNEWVGLEAIQIVGSMTAGTGLGRHPLTPRFTSIIRVFSIPEADKDQMDTIYSSYLYEILKYVVPGHPVWANPAKVTSLAKSTVKTYIQVKAAFSVDDNSHYIFTLRDLTRWCTGIIRYKQDESDQTQDTILEIWSYECMRLFRDKLVSETDRKKFDSILSSTLTSDWSSNLSESMINQFYTTSGTNETVSSLMPSFGRSLGKLSPKDWESAVQNGAHLFSRENWELDPYTTEELLNLTARCDRVLSMPAGSLLLAGRAGVGRRNAISIVSALQQARIVSLRMGKNYGLKQFKSDLKTAMQASGVENEQVYFLFEDHNMIDDTFLDMINSLLSSGEVPGLYTAEELEPILVPLKQNASSSGFSGDIMKFYAENVRKNLHIILVMDCSHEDFTIICESNPAFFKECSVQWLPNFSENTYHSLPPKIIDMLEARNETDENNKAKKVDRQNSISDAILHSFYSIHDSLDSKKTTPSKFVQLVQTYFGIVQREKKKIQDRKEKLSAGVSKLNDAREVVAKLKQEAAVKEGELAEKQSAANDALQMITDTMRNANTQKGEMQHLKTDTLKEEKKIAERKKAIDEELKEVEPLIEEAKKAVGNIKNETLSEIRSLRAPPEVIRDILEATLVLMGIQDTSWNSMKSFLSKRGVKEEIRNFDARRIESKSRAQVEQLMKTKSNSFTKEAAARASAAAAPLSAWVAANVKYSHVLEKIKPLEQEQKTLQSNLRNAENKLTDLTQGLDEVDQKVAVLKEKLNQFTKEAAEVEISLTKTKEIISAADQLVAGLEGEYLRWKQEVESMGQNLNEIPALSLIASGFLTYLADKPEDLRKSLIDMWCSKLGVSKFDLKHFLSSEQEMLQWRADGLPSDDLSLENAISILKSASKPFIIDPSSQATNWLKKHFENEGNLEVTNVNDERFFLNLELSIRFGKTLIVLDAETIEPVLYPLLRLQIVGQGPYKVVQVGEKQIDYNPNFKLFLVSRNTKPKITTNMQALVCVVNFTTTRAGLKGQLLGKALQQEKPELEERKSLLLKQEEDLKIQISNLEDDLLNQLANSSGNILENKDLLDSLNQTKTKSATIQTSLVESAALQESLDQEGNAYLPLADYASKLYFALTDLSNINNMYQYSLSSFLSLYVKTLKTVPAGNMNVRMENLKKTLQATVYGYISNSLFKSDRLMFALHLLHQMNPEMFLKNEWEHFSGMLIDYASSENSISIPDWIEEDRKNDVSKLMKGLPELGNLLQLEDGNMWGSFMKSEECEKELPALVSKKLSLFQKLLVVQALRPDRLVSALEDFLQLGLSLKELSAPALSMKSVFKETVTQEPILLIVSPGSDPSQDLRDLSVQNRQMLHEVALGQGQTDYAIEKLRESMKHGQWVVMKNLHLMTFWIPVLMKELSTDEIHPDFRLWLTAESHPKFPATLLESSLKISYEAPPGIKRNLQSTVDSWNAEFMAKGESALRAQTMFTLAWFNAVIQERRTFIPQGWASFYEFSDSDLRSGIEVIENLYANSGDNISWDFIHGLFKNAIFGGRVDNVYDLRILDSYLHIFFNANVLSGQLRAKTPLGPGLELPTSFKYSEYQDLVFKLPEEDKPSFFGLPPNIERAHQRNVSNMVIKQLRLLSLSSADGSKFDREKWQQELSPVLNLWKKLNQGTGILQLKLEPPLASDSVPIKEFVQLEFYNGVSLLQNVHKTLSAMAKVIKGTSLLDATVTKLAKSILRQETPLAWQKLWNGPENPTDYIKCIVSKVNEIQKWTSRVDQGSLLKDSIDFSDLFFPDTFLSALAQQSAREFNVSMSEMKLHTSWSKGGVSGAKISIKVSLLQLEGATFDGVRMVSNSHNSPSIQTAPTCSFAYLPESSTSASPSSEVIL